MTLGFFTALCGSTPGPLNNLVEKSACLKLPRNLGDRSQILPVISRNRNTSRACIWTKATGAYTLLKQAGLQLAAEASFCDYDRFPCLCNVK